MPSAGLEPASTHNQRGLCFRLHQPGLFVEHIDTLLLYKLVSKRKKRREKAKKKIKMGNCVCRMAKRMQCARSRNRTRSSPNELKLGCVTITLSRQWSLVGFEPTTPLFYKFIWMRCFIQGHQALKLQGQLVVHGIGIPTVIVLVVLL